MKPYKSYLIAFLLGVIICSGCSKTLDVENYGFYSENEILKTATDAENLLTGAYNPLSNDWNMFRQPYWTVIDVDNDHVTGPAWLMGGTTGTGNFTGFWGMNNVWQGHYTIIQRCNKVIEKVPPMKIDDVEKNNLVGEAYALRAWAYFSLVRMYGGVPVKTSTMESDPNPNIARSSVADVYNLIISDLTTANSLLLPKGDPKGGGGGRLNKAAAQTLLAKVYLTMASGAQNGVSIKVRGGKDNAIYTYTQNGVKGYEDFNSTTYFKMARDLSDSIISGTGGGGSFSLVPNFNDIFSKAQIGGTEAIWYLEFKDGTPTVNPLNMYYSPTSVVRGYGGWLWLSNNFYNSFEANDDRVLNGVYHQYYAAIDGYPYPLPFLYPQADSAKYAYKGSVKLPDGSTQIQQAKYLNRAFLKKYADVTNPDLENSDASIFMLRYADVLLMFAEAENETNGPTQAAYNTLNQVRRRSHASDAPIGMSKDDFRSFVIEERDRELAQENNRKFDLLRRGIYLQVMNQIAVDQENNTKSRQEKHLLYPIPQSELDANNKMTGNNPGW